MRYSIIGLTAALSTLTLAGITQAAVPNTFSDGEPAVASEVNENFTHLDTRITALENTPGVNDPNIAEASINCANGDSINNAISAAAPANHLFVYISGTCTERVIITRSNVSLLGDTTTPSGISFSATPLSPLQTSVSANELSGVRGAVNVLGAQNVIIDNLTISGGTAEAPTIGEAGKGVAVRFNGSVLIQNSTIEGNEYGIHSSSGGVAILSNNQIQNNLAYGIIASDAGIVRLIGDNTISQTGSRFADFRNSAIGAFRHGTVTILGGNTISASPSTDNTVFSASYGSQVRSYYGLLTANGDSSIGSDSHIHFRDVNYTGNISVGAKGSLRLQNRLNQTTSGVTLTGNILVNTLALADIRTGTTVNGNITCNGNSSYALVSGTLNGILTNC